MHKPSLRAMAALAVAAAVAIPASSMAQSAEETEAGLAYVVQSPVNLGKANFFEILTKSGISTTGVTHILGNLGVSPIDSTAITGFGLIMDSSGRFSRSTLVTGKVFAADYAVPTPAMLTTAIGDMQTAYNDAAGRTNPRATELGAGNIGGRTIGPGLYKWSSNVIIPKNVTLSGGLNSVWIFQIAGTLNISSGTKVFLRGAFGQPQAKNVFWQVAGQTTINTNAVMQGIILDKTAIVLKTGAKLNGKALAQTAVTLDANTINNQSSISIKSLGTGPVPEPVQQ